MTAQAPLNADSAPSPARRGLLYCTAALMPLAFNAGPWLDPQRKELWLSPLDALLPVLLVLLLWDFHRRRIASWAVPLPNLLWAGLALLSLAWTSVGFKEWARSACFQTLAMGLAAVWIFRHAAGDAREYRRLALTLGGSLAVCFLPALFQYVQEGRTVFRVSGWYEYRGQLAAQAAMLIPVCAAFAVLDRDAAVRAAAAALGVLAFCVCLTGGGVLAACAGVLAVAALLLIGGPLTAPVSAGPPRLIPERYDYARQAALLVCALLFLLTVVLPNLPRKNPKVLWRSLTLFAAESETAPFAERATPRLRRSQAVLNALAPGQGRWTFGWGAGAFQGAVNRFYQQTDRLYPKPAARTDDEPRFDFEADEKHSFGLIETTAVELGAAGLLALAWVFLAWLSAAAAGYFTAGGGPEAPARRLLALAAFGAGTGALVFSWFGYPLARGGAGTFAFFLGLALATAGWRGSTGTAASAGETPPRGV